MNDLSGVVAPTATFDNDDVNASTELLAQWLTDLTGDLVNWRTLITLAEVLPVAGSVFAATDAIGDIIHLVQGTPEYRADLFNWVGLGINLFAIAPIPGIGPARKVMRPMLKSARASAKDGIAQALLVSMESALADVCRGDLENLVKEIDRQLQAILASFAQKIVEICQFLAGLIRSAADGTAKSTALTVIFPGLRLVAEASDYAKRKTGYGLGRDQLGLGPDQKLLALLEPIALRLENLGRMAGNKIAQIGNKATPGSLAAILDTLKLALSKRKPVVRRANVSSDGKVTQARRVQTQNGTEAAPRQRPARADPNCRKAGVAGGTGCSISYALGSETISHTDFTLPGVFPIDWNRTYRSTLGAYDDGTFGARWTTPFSSRFDLTDNQLVYHGVDGRSQHYALPRINKYHHDPIEDVLIVRPDADRLVLARGHVTQELYLRDGNQFRLALITQRGGARIALFYEHRQAGRSVLSDLVTYQNDVPHQHIHTKIDAQGRISALWLMHEGQPQRQLASYTYDAHGDLCSAKDEHGAEWTYQYQHHLVTRYTDRTNRGINLEWLGQGPDAKAVREWADDGSFDTRLKWNPHIRLTTVTDALGQQTRHYYDYLGYTYRIIYRDGNEEWLFRDDGKNVIQHVHTDGSIDRYIHDERGNLLHHTRPDGSAVHHAYDDLDQRFKTCDAEDGFWKYDHDQRGNIIETLDPQAPPGPNPHSPRRINDNVLRSYCGTQYRYDERGNLLERTTEGKQGQFVWDLYNRLRSYQDDRLIVSFAYDALGRRLYKYSRCKYRDLPQAGPVWNENARRQRDEELGCGFTWYVWEDDTLAFECRDRDGQGHTIHYVFEPRTFAPVAQAVSQHYRRAVYPHGHATERFDAKPPAPTHNHPAN